MRATDTAQQHYSHKRPFATFIVVAACALAFAFAAAPSAAAAPPQLWQKCDSEEPAGQQCRFPGGIAADPRTGHLFVADQANRRVLELDAFGQFVKTWGWDVVASGPGDTGAGFEICLPEEGDVCKAGTEGGGSGQFGAPLGIALDSEGNVYVTDNGVSANNRVQKFSRAGQFLLMFGGDVNKTKVEEGAPEAERNLCTAASGDVCQKGTIGTGNGQFGNWYFDGGDFIAITSADKVYVGDENRIQRFDTAGAYQDEIALPGKTVWALAVDSAGNLYVAHTGSGNKVFKLSPTGETLSPSFEVPILGDFENPTPQGVAVDAAGHVWVIGPTGAPGLCSGCRRDPIIEFDPAGQVLDEFGIEEFEGSPIGIATNLCPGQEAPGSLYVANRSQSKPFVRAYGTAPSGCGLAITGDATGVEETAVTLEGAVNPTASPVSECRFQYGPTAAYGNSAPCAESPAEIGEGTAPVEVHADLNGLEKGTVYHYRLVANVGGVTEKGTDRSFKTLGPPVISGDHTVGAVYTEATLEATINPEGFPTTFRVEYVDLASFEAEGFANPLKTAEAPIGSDRTDRKVTVTLQELTPGTSYRWRIVATNSSGVTAGEPRTLNTYRVFAPETDCPNQGFRSADAAFLPDCRAYEMVSPPDKNGGDIMMGLTGDAEPVEAGGRVQAAPDGDKITYTATFFSFCGQPNSFKFNQYLATRVAGEGWSCEGLHPAVDGRTLGNELAFGVFRGFMGFTPDLCSAWLLDPQSPPPTEDGQQGYRNLYRRHNCGAGAGSLEALIPSPQVELPAGTPQGFVGRNSVEGISEDGRHAFFTAEAKLTVDAHSNGTVAQIYDRADGALSLVSVLPSGKADSAEARVGNGIPFNVDDAVSADGSRVYWTSGGTVSGGTGRLYVRTHPEQGIVKGECAKATKACTRPVSAGDGFFWAAAEDGSAALYTEGALNSSAAKLYEFDLQKAEAEEPAQRLIAEGVRAVAGASEGLSRVYFISKDALPGAGPNSEGDEAQAGQANLYLAEGEAFSFVATLGESDVKSSSALASSTYAAGSVFPVYRASRVSADGGRIVFESRAPLSGYDNTDGETGNAALEVFTYEAGGALECVSCNPSGARPRGSNELRLPYAPVFESNALTNVEAAAWIPTWEHSLHASNVLSSDGSRIFFNANDALLPRDTNGVQDVYEWEVPGVGSCTEDDPSYFPQNGGCLYLVSSGESPYESEFLEASPDGEDVFFTTASGLLPQDPGLIDIYDARVAGGFPQPKESAVCEGDACQSPPAPPDDPTPASAAFEGIGNVKKGASRARCPKGKRKVVRRGKVRCAKRRGGKPSKRLQRRGNHDRRAGR